MFYSMTGSLSSLLRKTKNSAVSLGNWIWLISFIISLFLFVYRILGYTFIPFEYDIIFVISCVIMGLNFIVYVITIFVCFLRDRGMSKMKKLYMVLSALFGVAVSSLFGYFVAFSFNFNLLDKIMTILLTNSFTYFVACIPLSFSVKKGAIVASVIMTILIEAAMIAYMVMFYIIPVVGSAANFTEISDQIQDKIKPFMSIVGLAEIVFAIFGKIKKAVKGEKE